ncbi:MAG: hypothetical protein GTO14_06940 [Anaerolineales bacterium]|nr:hypothetical protein [Anaerolineales bacterium]
MNEPIAVEARFEVDGTIRPMAFIWQGRRYRITSLGRQWEQDSERRFLVMTSSYRVYEVAYLRQESAWRLRRSPEDFGGVTKAV